MLTKKDWSEIVAALDYTAIPLPEGYLRRWLSWERKASGMVISAETAAGVPVTVRVDVIYPDVLRIRIAQRSLQEQPSAILVHDTWPPPPHALQEIPGALHLTTDRVRLVVQQYPWQLRASQIDTDIPFFQEAVEDRAYGPAYEVPPVGFAQTADGRSVAHEAIVVTPGESFYGFGERFSALDKWGQTFASWAIDCGNVTSQRAYKSIPFFLSTAGYGIFIHTAAPLMFDVGSRSNSTLSFDILSDELDYFLIYGPEPKAILGRYAELTGHAPVPPKWAFGFWISRCGYKTRAEVETVIHEMRARGFPCDVISLDPWWMGDGPWCTYTWDTQAFPDPPGMLAWLREQGIRTCLWVTPYIAPGSAAYEEGCAGGYFLRRADGSLSPVVEAFAGVNLAAVDFTNPQATAWFQSKLEPLLSDGAAVFKTDFGEQMPADAVSYAGHSGLELHNLYPLLYNAAVFELTRRTFGRGLTWGRSAYAGSQRYPVQWGGDSYASFDQMTGQLRGLLSYGMSGVPFCSHDIGGFDYPPRAFDAAVAQEDRLDARNILQWGERHGARLLDTGAEDLDAEVYIRWLQFGVFSSHTRAHGKQPREPWAYGSEAEHIARRYLRLRYRLLPYIYTEAVNCSRAGLPMVQPLVLAYPDDPNTARIDLEYLFGESFLVAPVLTRAGLRTRRHGGAIYLPPGEWVDYWTKTAVSGGRWIELTAPLDTLPLWVRAGAVIPMGPEMDYVDQKPCDPLTLEIYAPHASGSYVIHDEDRPDIRVHYTLEDSHLQVEVEGAVGAVEAVVWGAPVRSVTCTLR